MKRHEMDVGKTNKKGDKIDAALLHTYKPKGVRR
jgi:hypothetical protein